MLFGSHKKPLQHYCRQRFGLACQEQPLNIPYWLTRSQTSYPSMASLPSFMSFRDEHIQGFLLVGFFFSMHPSDKLALVLSDPAMRSRVFPKKVYSSDFLWTGTHLGCVSGTQSNHQGLELNKQKVNRKYHTRGEHKQQSCSPIIVDTSYFLNFVMFCTV